MKPGTELLLIPAVLFVLTFAYLLADWLRRRHRRKLAKWQEVERSIAKARRKHNIHSFLKYKTKYRGVESFHTTARRLSGRRKS